LYQFLSSVSFIVLAFTLHRGNTAYGRSEAEKKKDIKQAYKKVMAEEKK
jgi:hypothetical protein